MSKPTKEEIDLIYSRNWFKNWVLDELKVITNPHYRMKAQLYHEKYNNYLQHLPLIYVMVNMDKLKREITNYNNRVYKKHKFFKDRKWLDEEKNKNAYIIRPLKIPNPYPN